MPDNNVAAMTMNAQAAAAYPSPSLLIGGERIAHTERSRPIINPATEAILGNLPLAGDRELDQAIEAAEAAFQSWKTAPAVERAAILRRTGEILRRRQEEIATLLTLENGKTLAESRAEIGMTAEIFEWFAEEARRIYGREIPSRASGMRLLATREPIGVVAAFSPWNFPAVTSAKKVAAAVAAGCTVILKPAEETPATPFAMVECMLEAGLPAGVVNVVFGEAAHVSERLITSPSVRKVTFTGSTAVGRILAGLAARGPKPVTMELGGHAPVIVMDDVDAAAVASMALAVKLRNAGQICSSPTRFLVHSRVYDAFAKQMATEARNVRVGDGLDGASQMGPLSNGRRLEALEGLVRDAVDRGAELLAGGRRLGNHGYFYEPTVLGNVPLGSRLMTEEPFGPVVPLHPIDNLDQAIAIANSSEYGLASYVFSGSRAAQKHASARLEAGMVGINSFAISLPETPFGGVKSSGYGGEGGAEGIEPYLVTKLLSEA